MDRGYIDTISVFGFGCKCLDDGLGLGHIAGSPNLTSRSQSIIFKYIYLMACKWNKNF